MANEEMIEQLEEACRNGDTKSLILLLESLTAEQKASLRCNRWLQHTCAKSGRVDCLGVLSQRLDISAEQLNSADSEGLSCLHLAVIANQQEMVTYLLQGGVDLNVLDTDRHTPIHWAVVEGQADMVRELIEGRANIDIADAFNALPLHYAVQACDGGKEKTVRVVQLLLQKQCDVDVRDSDGRTALVWASSAGSHTAVKLLVKAGADAKLPDNDGLTALHCAASKGHQKVIDALVSESDCAVDSADLLGSTPLFYAASHSQLPVIRQLLNYGADPNCQDQKGRTPSHCAASLGKTDLLQELEERGANLWIKSKKNEYPVHETLTNQHSDTTFHLFDRANSSLDINCKNKEGLTFLHLAAKMGSEDLVTYLVDNSADVNAVYTTKNGTEVRAIDICDERGHRACATLLEKYGAVSSRPRSSGPNKQQSGSHPASSPPSQDQARSHSQPPKKSSQPPKQYSQRSEPTPEQIYGGDLPRIHSAFHQKDQKRNVKKEVKIVDHADVCGKENTRPHQQNALPEIPANVGDNRGRAGDLYSQTMLPFNRPKSASFVNISSLIRRPKTSPPKRDKTQTIKNKVRQSVQSYNTIRKSARDVQDTYLKGPRPESARPSPPHRRHRTSSTASSEHNTGSGHSTPSADGAPVYTIIATRGGFTKVRDNSQRRKNDPEVLKNLQQGKGNGILYVMDTNSHDTVGFTQGFDGRLRPRVGLVLKQPASKP